MPAGAECSASGSARTIRSLTAVSATAPAMRVSPVGEYVGSEEEVKRLSHIITSVSHSHPEGLKGAGMRRALRISRPHGRRQRGDIPPRPQGILPEVADISCAALSENYFFDVTCQGSVPQAIRCFYEGTDYEDTTGTQVSIGGDRTRRGCCRRYRGRLLRRSAAFYRRRGVISSRRAPRRCGKIRERSLNDDVYGFAVGADCAAPVSPEEQRNSDDCERPRR